MTTFDYIVMSILGAIILALFGWLICLMIKSDKASKKTLEVYLKRKSEYLSKMTERQRTYYNKMKGASQLESHMELEKRIHELEKQLRNQQDDGK